MITSNKTCQWRSTDYWMDDTLGDEALTTEWMIPSGTKHWLLNGWYPRGRSTDYWMDDTLEDEALTTEWMIPSGTRHWLLNGWYPRGLIIQQQRYRHTDSNKHVVSQRLNILCIKFKIREFVVAMWLGLTFSHM
jgi:hypothetical protein